LAFVRAGEWTGLNVSLECTGLESGRVATLAKLARAGTATATLADIECTEMAAVAVFCFIIISESLLIFSVSCFAEGPFIFSPESKSL
jgi:hypothetical protein